MATQFNIEDIKCMFEEQAKGAPFVIDLTKASDGKYINVTTLECFRAFSSGYFDGFAGVDDCSTGTIQ